MTQENPQFSLEQFRDKYPFPHLQMGLEELNAFRLEILNDREREIFTDLLARIPEAQDIARAKGIMLELRQARGAGSTTTPGLLNRMLERLKGPTPTTFRTVEHAQRYLDVDVYDLKTTERSIPSDTGWTISQIAPIDSKTQRLSSCEYTLPLGDEEKERMKISRFGERYVVLQGVKEHAETGIALFSYKAVKRKGEDNSRYVPLLVVTKSFNGNREPSASYMSSKDQVTVGVKILEDRSYAPDISDAMFLKPNTFFLIHNQVDSIAGIHLEVLDQGRTLFVSETQYKKPPPKS